MSKNAPSSRRGFTLIELLVVVAIIGILMGLLMPVIVTVRLTTKKGVAQAELRELVLALRMYETDHGIYPNAGGPLSGDTTVFVTCLGTRGPKGVAYHDFMDRLNDQGEFLSVFDEPYRYTWPGHDRPGPDGFYHPNAEFLLWTRGPFQAEPECRWEINSWTTP
jgi:prepilin-type N-terminal cleavage/methylation domain-containing protein